MRRHWINKLFIRDPTGVMSPISLATAYVADANENLIDHVYAYKEGNGHHANPMLCSERGVLEFWTEQDVDFVLLVIYIPGLLPTWFTWTHGNDPKYIDSGYSILERICELNDIEL